MKRWNNVAIVGVGLIGGSIGLALRQRRLAECVVGVGRNADRLRIAAERGAIDTAVTRLADWDKPVDIAVVCTPVDRVPEYVLELARRAQIPTLITDAGSTKAAMVDRIRNQWPGGPATYIGSHPLAGSERSGVEFADPGLFQDRVTLITPEPTCDPAVVADLEQWWQSLGSRVERMSPHEHDRTMAWISHLPHMAAAALVAATPEELLPWVASGWRDTTRVASGEVTLWSQIVAHNREHLRHAVQQLQSVLRQLESALDHDQVADWERLLQIGKERRDRVAD